MESERVNFMTSRSLTCLPVSQHLDGPPVVQGTFAPERTWVRIILFLLVTKQTDHVTRMTTAGGGHLRLLAMGETFQVDISIMLNTEG